jgi:hypothetical protein
MRHSLHSHSGGHAAEHNDPRFKPQVIGVYLGLLAVLIAVYAAVSNTERNLMTQAMVSQSRATSKEVAASVKFRLVLSELSQAASIPKEQRNKELIGHNLTLYKDYLAERDVAHELSEAMNPSIENHFEATEQYELAQLFAEIAIAIGSFSLLLRSRYAWYVSIVFLILSVTYFAYSKNHLTSARYLIVQKISNLEKKYSEVRNNHEHHEGDSLILKMVAPEGNF